MSAGFTRIALIGFGEVGQTLGADLLAAGASVSAYDPLFGNSNSVPSRALTKIRVVAQKTAPEAVRGGEPGLNTVTAASRLQGARSVVAGLATATFYLQVHSVSPGIQRALSA